MSTEEILTRLEDLFGFDPEGFDLMVEGRKDNARLSVSHRAATAILERLETSHGGARQ